MSIRSTRLRSRKAEIMKRNRWLPRIVIWEMFVGLKTLIGNFQIKRWRNLSQHRLSSYLGEIAFFNRIAQLLSHYAKFNACRDVNQQLSTIIICISYVYIVNTVPMHSWKTALIFHHDAIIDKDLVSRLYWLILSAIIKYLWRLLSVLTTYQICIYIDSRIYFEGEFYN